MQITTRQKRIGLVLAVCGTGLLIDRVFLAPQPASADDTETGSPVVAVQVPDAHDSDGATSPTPDLPVAEAAIAAHLQSLADARGLDSAAVPDAFAVPESWLPDEPPVAALPQLDRTAESFLEEHRVTATMESADGGYAIVDGEVLRVGQSVDGYTLISVATRSAVFEVGDVQFEIVIENESNKGPASQSRGRRSQRRKGT